MSERNIHEEVIATHISESGVLWETVSVTGDYVGEFVRAVCRPESCADGHRYGKLNIAMHTFGSSDVPRGGKLDLGIEPRGDIGHATNDLQVFGELWAKAEQEVRDHVHSETSALLDELQGVPGFECGEQCDE